MKAPKRCVGCEKDIAEPIKVRGLGYVCPLCHEVVDVVFEVEIERTRQAVADVQAFVESITPKKQRRREIVLGAGFDELLARVGAHDEPGGGFTAR